MCYVSDTLCSLCRRHLNIKTYFNNTKDNFPLIWVSAVPLSLKRFIKQNNGNKIFRCAFNDSGIFKFVDAWRTAHNVYICLKSKLARVAGVFSAEGELDIIIRYCN